MRNSVITSKWGNNRWIRKCPHSVVHSNEKDMKCQTMDFHIHVIDPDSFFTVARLSAFLIEAMHRSFEALAEPQFHLNWALAAWNNFLVTTLNKCCASRYRLDYEDSRAHLLWSNFLFICSRFQQSPSRRCVSTKFNRFEASSTTFVTFWLWFSRFKTIHISQFAVLFHNCCHTEGNCNNHLEAVRRLVELHVRTDCICSNSRCLKRIL